MEEVSERELVPSQVLLLRENLLVDLEVSIESGDACLVYGLVCGHAVESGVTWVSLVSVKMWSYIRLKNLFHDNFRGKGFKVGLFDRCGLLEEAFRLQVPGDEGCTLVGVFLGDISSNGTTLIENVPIVVLCAPCTQGAHLNA